MSSEVHSTNQQMYAGNDKIKLYANKDNNPKDSQIDYNEANEGSIFDNAAKEIMQEIGEGKIDKTIDMSLINKYLGFDINTFIKNNFTTIKYNENAEKDFKETAQEDLNKKIQEEITNQLNALKDNLKNTYGDKLKRAIELAEKEKPSLEPKQDKKTEAKKPELYNSEKGDVASFSSSKPDSEEKSAGYKAASDYLVGKMNAKSLKREVNGEKQEIFVFKENGETKRVVIDDAGQMHTLETVKTFGKNTYITSEAKKKAMEGLDNKDAKIKRRKVKGDSGDYRYENVIITKDNEGKKHAKVVDQDQNTGEIKISEELTAKKGFLRKTRYTGEEYAKKEEGVVTPKEKEVSFNIDGDSRTSANNLVGDEHGKSWGIDNELKATNSAVHKIHYNTSFSRKNFSSEGWYSNKARTKEKEYLKKMDDIKGDDKYTRNLSNAKEFATRFVKANFPNEKNINIEKLANAITVANPSVFKPNGDMLKNVDFSRINLPKNLSRYRS